MPSHLVCFIVFFLQGASATFEGLGEREFMTRAEARARRSLAGRRVERAIATENRSHGAAAGAAKTRARGVEPRVAAPGVAALAGLRCLGVRARANPTCSA
ncbi:MAG: hypothetical protein FWD73_11415 [Polyangiaceae bacterium]|nr:hypothetical protein [Polyangiaceae bacterium]